MRSPHSFAVWQHRDPYTPAHEAWVAARLDRAPDQWQGRLNAVYRRMFAEDGAFGANTWLRKTADHLKTLLLPLGASDADIRQRADELAVECMRCAGEFPGLFGFYDGCVRFCEARGIEPHRVDGPNGAEEDDYRAAIKRMTCPLWWRRRLRVQHGRTIEENAIKLGYVHLKRDKYVSDVNVWRRQQQRRRNAATLANVSVANQFGDEFTLAELAERSNANPRIRRAELMTRISGFEKIARGLGHVGEFVTVTCPSRFHSTLAASGQRNPSHDGSTPREAQQHLTKAWAQCRAFLARRGVQMYGFRIAEPHHDGCPHWHLLLFMVADAVDVMRFAVRRYFLDRHEPDEAGAQKNRVKFVSVEMTDTKSAAGYVIKYVSKNIDGYNVQTDLYGQDAVVGSQRVEAWAATWGNRQFQQIGAVPVGAWRELRRMEKTNETTPTIDEGIEAADAGDWESYVRLQGGPFVDRKSLRLRVATTRSGERFCPVACAPEPAPQTRYGEVAPGAIYGVRDVVKDRAFLSRKYKWEVRRAGSVGVMRGGVGRAVLSGSGLHRGKDGVSKFSGVAGVAEQREGVDKEAQAFGRDKEKGRGLGVRGFGVPWTRVNNCTGERDERREQIDGIRPANAPSGRERGGAGLHPAVFGADYAVDVGSDYADRSK